MRQFGRVARCVIGTTSLESLDFKFEVKAKASASPNVLNLEVYNLNDDTRKAFEAKGAKLPIQLDAGYKDLVGTLFRGKVREAETEADGEGNTITRIEAGDGEVEMRTSQIAITVEPGITAAALLEKVAKATGLGDGNLSEAAALVASLPSLFPKGGALSGNAMSTLERVCKSYGLKPSVQGEALLLLGKSMARKTAEEISDDTGLIGSPKVDSKRHVSFDCLLRPTLRVGDLLSLRSRFLNASLRVLELGHKGDTQGDEWTSSIVCDRV
jgi:hypothetical protein